MTTDRDLIAIAIEDEGGSSGYTIVSHRHGSWIVRDEDASPEDDDLFEGSTLGEALVWVHEHPKPDAAQTVHDLLRGLRLLHSLAPEAEAALTPGVDATNLARGVLDALAIIDGKDR